MVKGFQPGLYQTNGGGANVVAHGYTKGSGLGAEIVGTFVLFTLFSQLLMLREVPETLMSLSWLRFQLGLLSSWCTWLPSQLQELVSTQLVVLVQQSSSTRTRAGMITGFSGWVHSLEQHLQLYTTKL